MSVKRRLDFEFNWQSATPIPYVANAPLTGVLSGAMSGTSVVYTNIVDISYTDNQGLELQWTGTPTGTIEVLCSESGKFFFPLTFTPPLTQPAGGASGYGIDLNQVPWRYIMVRYTNVSGSGSLTAWLGSKGLS